MGGDFAITTAIGSGAHENDAAVDIGRMKRQANWVTGVDADARHDC
jgi:hypothetical protein